MPDAPWASTDHSTPLSTKAASRLVADHARAVTLLRKAAGKLWPALARDTIDPDDRLVVLHRVAEMTAATLEADAKAMVTDLAPESKGLADRIGGFFKRAARTLRTAYLAGALALLGPEMLEADAREIHSVQVAEQLKYLAGFQKAVHEGEQKPDGSLPNRAGLYGHATWSVGQNTARGVASSVEAIGEERRVLGGRDHCEGCKREAAKGWQPKGKLAPIGTQECRVNCRCSFQYR